MSERSHDHEPGPAALDELARAFGLGADESDEAVHPRRRAADAGDVDVAALDLDEHVDEHVDDDERSGGVTAVDPTEEPTAAHDLTMLVDDAPIDPPEPTPPSIAATNVTAPTIIRIDDITGTVAAGDSTPVPVDAAHVAVVPDRGAPDDQPPPTVIAIDADDLPDAVYVAGSLDGGAKRSIVFIEDDAEADALQPESDRDLRRGIEPRMRERRVQVRRAQSRKRLRWVVAGFGVLLVLIGALAVLGSSLFAVSVDHIDITGNVYTDPERLDAVLDDLVGTPTLRVDTTRIERDIESIPWVEDAKVTVAFPRSASIEIREREAMVTYQGPDGRFRVLDREGRVLDVLDRWPIAYVLVVGPDPVDLEPAQFAPQGYVGAAELARNLTGSVRGQVVHIEVTADGQRLSMLLDDGTEVRFGEARDLFTKLVRLETRLLDPDRESGTIDVATD